MPFSSNINPDDVYKGIITDSLQNGNIKGDRTGTGTVSVVGRSARYSLLNGRSPRLTTKLLTDTPEREMLWFRNGKSSIKELRDQGIGIWNGWMVEGTAKYRTRTPNELLTLLAKKYDSDAVRVHFTTIENLEEVKKGHGINTTEKLVIKITLKDTGQKSVDIYGSEAYFTSTQGVLEHATGYHNIAIELLTDGDIGPGGYGPQWRHWKDTQIILDSQCQAYLNEGYKVVGRTYSSFGADYHDWDLMDKIKDRIYVLHPEVTEVCFHLGCDDVSEYNDNTFKWNCAQSVNVMDIYYSGERALQELYKSLYLVPTLIVYREIDQLANAINLLRTNPDSRRIIVSAWNPGLTWQAALPPCHCFFQFISHELTLEQRAAILKDRVELESHDLNKEWAQSDYHMSYPVNSKGEFFELDTALSTATEEFVHVQLDEFGIKRRGLYCFLLLRSNDLALGQPFNVAQYASLTHMIAQCVDMEPLELIWNAVDAHAYANHVTALHEQLERQPKDCIPRIKLDPKRKEIDDFTIDDITIVDYESHPSMASKMPPAI